MALFGMIFRIERTIDCQWLCGRLQRQEFRAFTLLLYGHSNSRVCLRWTWTPVVPGSEVTVPFRMRVYRTFPPVAPITSEYEWAKAMKADLLIIVRRVAWKFSEGELTELYRLWRHWCAEVERLAPGPSGS
jgi:hypothetical protein